MDARHRERTARQRVAAGTPGAAGDRKRTRDRLDAGFGGSHHRISYKSLERSGNSLRERFLFVTGDVIAAQAREFLERNHLPHVAKPFRVEELTEKVHGVLNIAVHQHLPPAEAARKKVARNG